MNRKLRLAVLASGDGTNLQALIDRSKAGQLDAEIVLVISNNPDAGALGRAAQAGIAHICIDHRQYNKRADYDNQVVHELQKAEPDLIILAGYMRLLTPLFIEAFAQRIINIHPSLLPAFPGLNAHKQALDCGVRFSGCTVHFVDNGVDTGPIILQAVVPIHGEDDPDSLAARILEQEHKIYPQAIQLFVEGRIQIKGRKVFIAQAKHPDSAIINPSG